MVASELYGSGRYKLRYHFTQEALSMCTEREAVAPEEDGKDKKALRVIGWFSMGMAVATVGICLGFEIRSRYKFKRRTPYDFYSNAAQPANEFGVGI
jgi:hypothetical protein